MKTVLFAAAAVLWAAAARAEMAVEAGKTTPVKLRIVNHRALPVKNLRLKLVNHGDWLKVALDGAAQVPSAGAREQLWDLKPVAEQAALEMTLQCAADAKAMAGDFALLEFALWEKATEGGEPRPGAVWEMNYGVRASAGQTPPPDDLEWRLVEARRASEGNEAVIRVTNASKSEPLVNVGVIGIPLRGLAKLGRPREGEEVKVAGVKGLTVVKPGESGEFKIEFSVSDRAMPGDVETLLLNVKTSTLGARPNPWDPYLLVTVTPPDIGLPGDFEAFLYYNLPPVRPAPESGGAMMDPKTWLPVPKGSRVTVSQVYTLPGAGGAQKYVEQFVGYGYVIDGRGYTRLKLAPVPEPKLRLRVVVETMANRLEVAYKKDAGGEVIERFKVHPAWAAVTPFGKRLFRNISHTFLAQQEKEASVIRLPSREGAAVTEGAKTRFYRVLPGQEKSFVVGEGLGVKRILIPYYGYEKALDPKRDAGILIKWEGELSTGGHINFFGQENYSLLQDLGGAAAVDAHEQMIAGGAPGLIYHNHNELLHALAALVKAQEYLAKLNYFRADLPRLQAAGTPAKPRPEAPPGVIAFWKKGQDVTGGETGYALRDDGTWRLMIQAGAADPDEQDEGLVLRGFGGAVRNRFFKPDAKADPARLKAPRYDLYKRTSVDQAWRQGFDLFFAACVLGAPGVLNEVAADETAKKERSVNVESVLAEARRQKGKKAGGRDARGADNAVAVAAGLWRAGRDLSRERLMDMILEREGGDLGWFLSFVADARPDLLKDMAELGLCPSVAQWPPAASAQERLSPHAARLMWNDAGVLASGPLKASVVFGPASAKAATRLELKGGGKGAPAAFSFGLLRNGAEGNAQLQSRWNDNEAYVWTVETEIAKGVSFRWPMQGFVASVPSTDASRKPASAALGQPGTAQGCSVDYPAGASSRPLTQETYVIHSVLGGREVLGGAVYRLGQAGGAPLEPYAKPVKLTLAWRENESPAGGEPGIYRLDPATEAWEFVGGKRVGARQVEAMIDRPGCYALMVDRQPPAVASAEAGPNPFLAGLAGVTWKYRGRLSEPATVTLTIEDKTGRVARTLLKDAASPQGAVEAAWDGKDDAGADAPEGGYVYRLVAVDASKQASTATGGVAVLRGAPGSARGKVALAAAGGPARVEAAGMTLATECGADGGYWLIGLPAGAHTLVFSAPGFFDEEAAVEVKRPGGDVAVPEVTLTRVAITDVQSSGEVFTPNGDGKDEYLSLKFNLTRPRLVDVSVCDERGEAVATLLRGRALPAGPASVVWAGRDDEGRPLPSGWYTARLAARNRGEAIPQGEVKALLDRGLAQQAQAFPRVFSPNGDGFDDVVEFGYRLENDALVSASVLRPDGSVAREVAKDARQAAGWNTLSWDGKGPDGKVCPDGVYQFEIRPKYLSGHESIPARGEFMSDATAPELADMSPVNGSTVNTGMPTVSARVASDPADIDPSQLKFKIDEQTALADSFDPKTGVFKFTPRTSLGEGAHIAIAYAQDWAGNYAPPQAVSFQVKLGKDGGPAPDTAKPEIVDLRPAKGETVFTATPLIVALARDLESGLDPANCLIHINGERVSNAMRYFLPGKSGKPWDWYSYQKDMVLFDPLLGEIRYVPLEPMKEGKNSVTVEVTDKAGNVSKRAETLFEVALDSEAPTVSDLRPAAGASLGREVDVISATLADTGKSGLALDTLRVVVDGEALALDAKNVAFDEKTGRVEVKLAKPLSRDAQHSVSVSVRDKAGNLSPAAVSVFSVVADGEAPRIELIAPAKAVFAAGEEIAFSAAVFDLGRAGLDEARLAVTLDGKAIAADDPKAPGAGGWLLARGVLSLSLKDVKPGTHVLTVAAWDRAGNAAAPLVWKFDVR